MRQTLTKQFGHVGKTHRCNSEEDDNSKVIRVSRMRGKLNKTLIEIVRMTFSSKVD